MLLRAWNMKLQTDKDEKAISTSNDFNDNDFMLHFKSTNQWPKTCSVF